MIEGFIAAVLPVLKTGVLALSGLFFGAGADYIRKKIKIEMSDSRKKEIWELAKQYVFQIEEASERFKKKGLNKTGEQKRNEAVLGLQMQAGISKQEAEFFIDAALGETGIAASGKRIITFGSRVND